MKNEFKEFMNGFKTMFNDLKTKGRRHKQIANLITLSRLLLSLFIPPLAIAGGIANLKLVVGIAIAAALTDFVDGRVAEMLDAKSEFGAHLDPVCDKLFATILLVPLMVKASPLLTLSLCANLGLEAGIALVNLNSKAKGNVPRTTILGKVKTASLSALLVSSYLSFTVPMFATITPIAELITIGLQTTTLVCYEIIDMVKDKAKLSAVEDIKNGKPKRDLTGKSEYYKKAYNASYYAQKALLNNQVKIVSVVLEQTKPATASEPTPTEVLKTTTPIKDPHALDGLSKEQLEALKAEAEGAPTASGEILNPVAEGKIMIL